MTNTTRYLGTSDDVTTCDCCGRKNLRSTVALSINEGDPVYYGVTCAALALRVPARDVRAGARAADREIERQRRAVEAARASAAYAADQAWLDAKVPALRGERFRQIEALGGFAAFAAARAARS